MKQEILKSYKHFRKYGVGGIVGQDAQICLEYARVEYIADKIGIVPQWDYDNDDAGPRDWTDDEDYIKRWNETDHTCLYCYIEGEDGDYQASLSGIWDADDNYRRIIEADLLSEVMPFNDLGMMVMTR